MAERIVIYHNPRCRKSREALAAAQETGAEIHVREYLKEPLDRQELQQVLAKLNLSAREVLRTQESLFREQFKGLDFQEEEWVQTLIDHPKLLERPIVERGNRAVIARSPEKIREILG